MAHKFLRMWVVSMIAGALFLGCAFQEDDVTFARHTMEQLIEGRYAASSRIDWPRLVVMGFDVGKQYAHWKTEQERTDYARSFINAFSKSYKSKGAKSSAFFGWRMSEYALKDQLPGFKTVAAYCYDKNTVVLFFLAEEKGKKKLVEIVAVKLNSDDQAVPAVVSNPEIPAVQEEEVEEGEE
ncbi:MAG: hypothetical protein HZB36_03450 [Candidatus Omnitrophica bacterium]|nr:hypothetical protein [Candidatus Omnitrophota bacterium]